MDAKSRKILETPAQIATAVAKLRAVLSRAIGRDVATLAANTKLPIEATRYILDQAVLVGAVERTKGQRSGPALKWSDGTTWRYRALNPLPDDFDQFVDKQAEFGLDVLKRRVRS